jgi:Flp pilus assembly protein TadD
MQVFEKVKKPLCTALCFLIGGACFVGQPAYAGWNPFARGPAAPDAPPPGMTEVEESANSPLEKGFAHPDEEKDDKRPAVDPLADEVFDPAQADPELHLRLAKTLIAKKKYKEALVELNETLKLNKNLWEARFLGAYIYQLEGRNAEAITRYKQYLAVKPDNQQAHINLGVLLRQEGKTEEAEDAFRESIKLNFFSLESHYNLANLLISQGTLEEALKELRACERIAPTNAWVHNNLGVIYQRRDYLEEADQEFNKAANLEPANQTFSMNLSMVREQLARKKQAKLKDHLL